VTAAADILVRWNSSASTDAAPPPRPQWKRRYSRALILTDVTVVAIAMAGAQMVNLGLPVTATDIASVYYSILSVLVAAIWLTMLAVYRTRSPRVIGVGVEEYRRVMSATLATVAVIAVALMILRPGYARGYLALGLPLGMFLLILCRGLCRRFLARQRRRGNCMTAVLAVGDARAVRELVKYLSRESSHGYSVVGVCLTGQGTRATVEVPGVGTLPVLGDETDIEWAIAQTNADTVALTATEHLGPDGIRELSWDLHKLDVDLVVSPGVVDVAGPRLTIQPVSGLPLIHVEKPQYRGAQQIQKRAFDVLLSMVVLIGALPVMTLAAIAVKLTSKGPVFYRSERIGIDGDPFELIKFRTMVDGADTQLGALSASNDSDGVLFKMRDDPRVTRVGRVLRRYSIDELPQFFNVLGRDMSVVGPRPPLRCEVDTYSDQVRRRLLVLPGITGLWQVSGRSDLSWEDSVRLDLSYVENWSIANDFLIAAKTIGAVLAAKGAY